MTKIILFSKRGFPVDGRAVGHILKASFGAFAAITGDGQVLLCVKEQREVRAELINLLGSC